MPTYICPPLQDYTQNKINEQELLSTLTQYLQQNPDMVVDVLLNLDQLHNQQLLPSTSHKQLRDIAEQALHHKNKPTPPSTSSPLSSSLPTTSSIEADTIMVTEDEQTLLAEDKTLLAKDIQDIPDIDATLPAKTDIIYSATQKQTSTSHTHQTKPLQTEPLHSAASSKQSLHYPGKVIRDRFILEEEIGRGAMGTVYKALDKRREEAKNQQPYIAIKIINDSFTQSKTAFYALEREARKTQSLKHPNILTVNDFDRDGELIYITMELLSGSSLKEYIKHHYPNGMPPYKAFPIIKDLASALSFAHQHNIIHCDFKPGNIFITDKEEVKVIDFGIARAANTGDDNTDNTLFDAGVLNALTPAYASCEMFYHLAPAPQDDIYALACVSYELLTGKHPFKRKRAPEALLENLQPKRIKFLSSSQWKGLLKGLAFTRDARTATIDEFADSILPKTRFYLRHLKIIIPVLLILFIIGFYQMQHLLQQRHREQIIQQFITTPKVPQFVPLQASMQDPPVTEPDSIIIENKLIEKFQYLILHNTDLQAIIQHIAKLPTRIQDKVYTLKTQSAIVQYYKQAIDQHLQQIPVAELFSKIYHYLQAKKLLQQALQYYPDSNTLNPILNTLRQQQKVLLDELSENFDYFESKKDLSTLGKIITALQNIDNQYLSQNPRFKISLLLLLKQHIQKNDLVLAETLFNTIAPFFPADPRIKEIKQLIQTQKATAKVKQRLQYFATTLNTINDFRNIIADSKRLQRTSPQDPLLHQITQQLNHKLEQLIQHASSMQALQEAKQLVIEFSSLFPNSMLAEFGTILDKQHQLLQHQLEEYYKYFQQAIDNQRYIIPKKSSAEFYMNKMLAITQDHDLSYQARNRMAQYYLQQLQVAQTQLDIVSIEKLLDKSIALQPENTLLTEFNKQFHRLKKTRRIVTALQDENTDILKNVVTYQAEIQQLSADHPLKHRLAEKTYQTLLQQYQLLHAYADLKQLETHFKQVQYLLTTTQQQTLQTRFIQFEQKLKQLEQAQEKKLTPEIIKKIHTILEVASEQEEFGMYLSAYDSYIAILNIDSNNITANTAIEHIPIKLATSIQKDIDAQKYARAERNLSKSLQYFPNHPQLLALKKRLEKN